jgi:organic radical activating enzyme
MKDWNVGIDVNIISCSSPDNTLRINWHILNWCNFKCSYCSVKDSLSYDYSDMSQISKEYKLMISRLKLIKKPFEICLTGGEPTLHPNIKEILFELNNIKNVKKIWFFTNLSRSINFFKKLGIFEKVVYYASYHPEHHDKTFLEKCKELSCQVHISMLNSHKNKVLETINECKSQGIVFCLNFLYDTPHFKNFLEHDFQEYAFDTDDMIEIDLVYENGMKEKTTNLKMLYEDRNKFKGYKCIPESYQITLDNIVKNVCSDKVMSLSLHDMEKQILCPKDKCEGGLMMYPKELK